MATSDLGKQTIYLRALLVFLGQEHDGPTDIYCDNESAVWFASSEEFPSRMRHVNMRLYAIREMVQMGHVRVVHVAGVDNVADIMTKQVPHGQFVLLREEGMCWAPVELMD